MGSLHPPKFSSSTPHFFNIILTAASTQKLNIPKKFVRKFGEELSSSVYLKLPSGSEWKVGLTRCNGKIWFEKGWPEFSVFCSLVYGDFVLFRYEGNSRFHVCILDMSATEIDYPVKSPNIQEADDNDDLSVEILENIPPTQRREKSPLPCPSRKKMRTSSSDEVDMIFAGEDEGTGRSSGTIKFIKQTSYQAITKALAFQRADHIKSGDPSFVISMQPSDIQSSLSLPWTFAERYLMKQPTSNITLCISDGRIWPVQFTYSTQKAQFQGGWLTFVKDNNLKVGDACVFLLIKDIKLILRVIFFRTSEASEWLLPQDCRDSSSSERFLNRTPHEVLGRMKPSTENKKANAFKSDKPSFSITMVPSSISHSCLSVPNEFSKRYLIKLRAEIAILQVSDGRTWHVKFMYDHVASRARLLKGWSSFVRDNNLKAGDACVFTLINCSELSFEVDISPTKESTERPLSRGLGRGEINKAQKTRNPIVKVEPECNMDSVSCSLEIGKNKNSKFSGDVTQRSSSSSLQGLRVNTQSANMFASENPFFEITLKSYNIKKSLVRAPVNFSISSIEPGKHIVNLQVKDRSWPVNLIKHDKPRRSTTIYGGWAAFAKENCLKEGDVCIFELIEEDIVLKVHIIRC